MKHIKPLSRLAACLLASNTIAMVQAAGPAAVDANTMALFDMDKLVSDTTPGKPGGSAKISGGVEVTPGKFGQALRFDGNSGKLAAQFPKMLQIPADGGFTIEAWVQVTKSGTTQAVYSLPPFCELEIRRDSGAVSFNVAAADGSTNARCTGKANVVSGEWHHIAATRDPAAKKLRVYVDGKLDAEVDDATAGKPLVIGETALIGGNAGGTEMLGGAIDDLRFSNTVRKITRPAADEQAAVVTQRETLENGNIKVVFNVDGPKVSLGSLIDKVSGQEFVEQTAVRNNLWQAHMRSATRDTVVVNEGGIKPTVTKSDMGGGKKIEFVWKGLAVAGKPGLADVTVSVTLAADAKMADWRIKFDNRSDTYGLWTAVFPRVTNFAKISSEGKDVVAIPGGNGGGAGEGQAYPDPFTTMQNHSFLRTYPCYHQAMQFNTYYNEKAGLYLATYDGRMNLKAFMVQPQARSGTEKSTLLYETHLYPADAGVAGTGITQDYPHYIGTFKGDWYDASKIYRDWALKQTWAAAGPLEKRKDISPVIRDGAYWMVGTFEWEPSDKPFLREKFRQMPFEEAEKNRRVFDAEKSFQGFKKASDYFGFPLMFWTNEWFDAGGDLSPPRYIHHGNVPQIMDRIHRELPGSYVTGHMQMKRYSIQLPEFTDEVKASIEDRKDGKPQIEEPGAMAEDKHDQHAYPCWATDFWKKFWTDKAKWIVNQTHLDGFHVDELGSAVNFDMMCFNPKHGHPVGGGTLYADTRRANIDMLRKSARTVNPNFAIHHEALSEIYLDRVDAAEVDTAPSNKNVPMWEAVYHDYSFVMGRRIHPWMDRRLFHEESAAKYGDNDINQFAASFAQTYIWGNQPGWTRIDIMDYAPRVADLIKRWHNVRLRNMKFLNTGEFIRPLTLKTPQEMMKTIWTTCDTPEHILPAIQSSVWKGSDGSIGFVLANATDKARKIHYAYDLSDRGGKQKGWTLTRTDKTSPVELGSVQGDQLERTDEVPAFSVIVVTATPNG